MYWLGLLPCTHKRRTVSVAPSVLVNNLCYVGEQGVEENDGRHLRERRSLQNSSAYLQRRRSCSGQ